MKTSGTASLQTGFQMNIRSVSVFICEIEHNLIIYMPFHIQDLNHPVCCGKFLLTSKWRFYLIRLTSCSDKTEFPRIRNCNPKLSTEPAASWSIKMKLPYALLGLTIFVFITVMATIHVTPSAGYFKSEALPNPTCPNGAPTAAADSYTVHGSFETPVGSGVIGVLKNDSDPENEALHCDFQNVQTPIGLATIYNNGKAAFNPNYGQTGDATINYSACDPCNTCSQASVTFHVVNQTPIAGNDE